LPLISVLDGPDLGSDVVFLVAPVLVAALAVWARDLSATARWGIAGGIAATLSLAWLVVAHPDQTVSAPAFLIIVPVGATFWVVSLVRRAAAAWAIGTLTCLGVSALGLIVGVNVGLLRP
jgi:hypothetical protein